jgi:hypothetical protein
LLIVVYNVVDNKTINELDVSYDVHDYQQLLDNLNREKGEISKLEKEVNKALELFGEKKVIIDKDIMYMENALQGKALNMSLNVVNNIKKELIK